jgi:5-histidylcysteine sulfoxide synthase
MSFANMEERTLADTASARGVLADLSQRRGTYFSQEDYASTQPNAQWPALVGLFKQSKEDRKIHSLPLPNLSHCTRSEALTYFNNTWSLVESLFTALKTEEAFYRIPYHQLRHPMIFYYGHPAIFYINKCRAAGLIKESVNDYFEDLFAVGVDEMSWDDMSKNHRPWPLISEVMAYRSSVYDTIKKLIETHPAFETRPITQDHPLWALFMCFEHLETSSILIRELPLGYVKVPDRWAESYSIRPKNMSEPLPTQDFPQNIFINLPQADVSIGKPKSWPSYGWDNEYGELHVTVPPFRATQFLISNGEFLAFVKAGGYKHSVYWSEEGWQWRQFRSPVCPTFWVDEGSADYKLRLCFEVVPMQWSWPVEVNFHEAFAYCQWRSQQDQQKIPYRLITEAEHHRLRDPLRIDPVMVSGGREMKSNNININLAYGSSCPVNASTPSRSGFYDTFGNVWEWSSTHFSPLPGFKTHPLYEDFSTPCFDERHNMILGGSFISTGDEASRWARFHFRRHFFQHVGFRLVQSVE